MIIQFGVDKYTKESVVWDSDKVSNRHMLLLGDSGSGKTFLLKNIAHGMASSSEDVTCYIFDAHGDIKTHEDYTSTIGLGANSNYGLQPLEILEDKEAGGVYNAINTFIDAMGSLGVIQRGTLFTLIEDLYKKFGFFQDDPNSYSLHYDTREDKSVPKRFPTLKDLLDHTDDEIRKQEGDLNETTFAALKNVWKCTNKVKKLREKANRDDIDDDEEKALSAKLEEAREAAVNEYKAFIYNESVIPTQKSSTSGNIEIKTLKPIKERLLDLYRSGIFKEKEFSFDTSKPIQRFGIDTLSIAAKKVFVQLALEKIYRDTKAKGETSKMRCTIFLDEAKDYISKSKDTTGAVERLILESRKYGVQVVLAGQHIGQFNADTISNCSTKIVLGVDSSYRADIAKKFSIPRETVENIIPKKNILIEIKNNNEKTTKMREVLI